MIDEAYINRAARLSRLSVSTVKRVLDTTMGIIALDLLLRKDKMAATPYGRIVDLQNGLMTIEMGKDVVDLMEGRKTPESVARDLLNII